MKKHALVIILVFVAGFLSAQAYEPLIDTTKQWNFLYHVESGECKGNNDILYDYTIAQRFGGDTIINGLKYNKLENCTNDSTYKNWKFYNYCIREVVDSQKVYINEHWGTETLLYDFSLEKGDSLYFIGVPVLIDSVAIKFIANKNRKVQYITCYMDNTGFELIEGVGTKFGLYEHYDWFMGRTGSFPTYNLLCFSKNSELLYKNGESCFLYNDYTNISNKLSKKEFSIFPNPVSERITIINNSQINDVIISISTVEGRLVLREKMIDTQMDFLVNQLIDGLYFFTISRNNEIINQEKIIVNH